MQKRTKRIGIVGGAGPMAGVLFVQKIIEVCQKTYRCKDDEDFPEIHLLSFPFSNMLADLHLTEIVRKEIESAVDRLCNNGMDYVAIACNTLHGFLSAKTRSLPQFVDLIGVGQEALNAAKKTRPLILCSNTSATLKIHTSTSIYPNKSLQKQVDKSIDAILSGMVSKELAETVSSIINECRQEHPEIDSVLFGCTEFSVLHDRYPLQAGTAHLIDPVAYAAAKLAKKALNNCFATDPGQER